ncbi:Guanine nucleotide-binding protein alpha-1 subunit [Nakaseomyces bracarensis]|uniref:Guanine nucleotide-binding protein alpha-1 subunit n=1 Tax=Nakaseomyces bracarensis TaxID=273131 RepID=A0ABR4NVQ6_9SACH
MGCILSTSAVDYDENDPFLQSRRANDAIEQTLTQQEKLSDKNEIKLLLLGAGESGKSTVLKQLRLLHQGGFTYQERLQYAQVIWADVIQSMKILIIQARKLGIKLDCDDPANHRELYEDKRLLLSSNAINLVDTSVAGGPGFLNDYVIKYSERYAYKRKKQSTGKVEAFGDGNFSNKSNVDKDTLNFEEISEGLHETGNGKMFIETKQTFSPTADNRVIAKAIKNLWTKDTGIKQCFHCSNEFQLESSASYFFDNVERFSQPDYVCTDEDILKGRIKTTGITETEFNIDSTKFKVYDAGGQRSERKKWIHCFEGITAVLFVLALSEYDQVLFEDSRVSRMHESIMLFETLINSRWFRNTPFILFLNKVDIFEDKVKREPIRKYFPDCQAKVGDAKAGIKYFEKLFLGLNRSNKPIYVKQTCATDTDTMKFVLSAVTDLIIQQNLKKSGLI